MKKNKSFFSKQLRKIMVENNLNQMDLKEKTGIAQTVISRWVRDEAVPSFNSVKKLADAFNVPLNYFLENYEDKNSDENISKKLLKLEEENLKINKEILKELEEIKNKLNG